MQLAALVTKVYDAVVAGEYEVVADELTAQVKAALSGPVEALYPELRLSSPWKNDPPAHPSPHSRSPHNREGRQHVTCLPTSRTA